MPLVTYVIDDKSPLISYDSTWIAGSALDSFATDYYRGTFTINNVTNGLASFSFNGTAIWIYGANRPNHGSYAVQIDGATYSNLNGAGNNLFQQSLFNVSSLSQGMHTMRLTNTGSEGLYVDVDMIVWQSQVGNTSDQMASEIIQDTDSRFQYQEPAWSATSVSSNINFGLFSNGTGHVTQTYDASVTFTFIGMFVVQTYCHAFLTLTHNLSAEAISLFGVSGPSNGPYSVQLDGGQAVQYNALTTYPTNYGAMIYHADNLGPGSHQLVLTNLPTASGQSLCIDYAELWTMVNTSASTSTTGGTSISNTASGNLSQNVLTPGAIAGIVIAVIAAVLSAGAALLFYRRWKAAIATQQDHYRAITPQQRSLAPATVTPTGYSSSLEARSNVSVLRNDTPTQAFSGGVQQLVNNYAPQYDVFARDHPPVIAISSRDSRSIIDTPSSPTGPTADEGLARRPLPGAPGGGMSLSDEFPKLASLQRRPSTTTADHVSITVSEALPNYTQATGNPGTTHR